MLLRTLIKYRLIEAQAYIREKLDQRTADHLDGKIAAYKQCLSLLKCEETLQTNKTPIPRIAEKRYVLSLSLPVIVFVIIIATAVLIT